MRRGDLRVRGGHLVLQPRDPRKQRVAATMHPVGAMRRQAGELQHHDEAGERERDRHAGQSTPQRRRVALARRRFGGSRMLELRRVGVDRRPLVLLLHHPRRETIFIISRPFR